MHGDPVPAATLNDGSGLPHLVVADLVFRECLLRELFKTGCFGNDLRQAAEELAKILSESSSDSQPFDAAEWVLTDRLGFRRIHEKLGWCPAKAP